MVTTISSKGQITVPASIREALGLTAGTRLELRLGPNGSFVTRKTQTESHFTKFRGMAKAGGFPDSDTAMQALRGSVEKGDTDR